VDFRAVAARSGTAARNMRRRIANDSCTFAIIRRRQHFLQFIPTTPFYEYSATPLANTRRNHFDRRGHRDLFQVASAVQRSAAQRLGLIADNEKKVLFS